ncbi:MAG: tetratricopeptide repeat protein [Candidatus Hydrogenedentes bacterium]|nr:tetratricopeptide repeat protein [Candidatus Hydrogenedentota bacterium]
MTPTPPVFPEYGDGGDQIGARRSRRAFRLCVTSSLFLATMLWVAEYFLRHELTEAQYLSALTMAPESARAVLQQTVKRDEAKRGRPTPKYVQALAEREEDEVALEIYKKAYALDPQNPTLAVRYGCRLFFTGRPVEARERFREASIRDPENALPSYLEAAVLPWVDQEKAEIGESVGLIEKVNRSERRISFPKPLWFSGLSESGKRYAELRRQNVGESCEVFLRYANLMVERAKTDFAEKHHSQWDTWLHTIDEMGQRLVETTDAGSLQALAGVNIRLSVLPLREQMADSAKNGPPVVEDELRSRLEAALGVLREFEDQRYERIERQRTALGFPLDLSWKTAVVLIGVYLPFFLLSKSLLRSTSALTLSHSRLGQIGFLLPPLVLFGILATLVFVFRWQGPFPDRMPVVARFWWLLVAASVVVGLLYPALRLPWILSLRRDHAADTANSAEFVRAARKSRRRAYICLLRRYFGILAGFTLATIAFSVGLFRVVLSFYPWQLELLTPGQGPQELETVQKVLILLAGS